jgi:hypothetical protein
MGGKEELSLEKKVPPVLPSSCFLVFCPSGVSRLLPPIATSVDVELDPHRGLP